jgi:hypothetical protein
MHRIRTMGRPAALLACLATMSLATGAAPALAAQVPPSVGGWSIAGLDTTQLQPQVVYTVAAGGMPGWQIALIAIGAAVAAAVVAVLLDRARTARRMPAPVK